MPSRQYVDAGFDRVYINQIGDQPGRVLRLLQPRAVPALAEIGAAPDSDASRETGK